MVILMKKLNDIIVTDICEAITVFSEKGRVFSMKNRESYGISFCLDGQITYIHNGAKFISDKKHAVILPKAQSYTLYGNKRGYFPLINFQCEDDLCDTFILIPIEDTKSFMNDYERIKALSLFEGNNAKIMSIFYGMLDRLSSLGRAEGLLKPALRYIEQNFSDPSLTNQLLAKECKISEVYLRKLFDKELKISPKQFIIDIRIQKAKQLLSEGSLKVRTVSEMCGFSNPYHFCRIFKAKCGLTPTEYACINKYYKI